jgi:multicomponent Na+:H+ antiporter subunit D
LSLAGLPPLSGFWAKLYLVRSGLEAEQFLIVGVALVVGLLTLYSMTKIWASAFWAPPPPGPGPPAPAPFSGWMLTPVVALAGLTVLLGLWAQPLAELAARAAQDLLDPGRYIEAVLRTRP